MPAPEPTSAAEPAAPSRARRRRRAPPGRVLVPVVLGLGLLGWALELGKRRPRAAVQDAGGPLVTVPAPESP